MRKIRILIMKEWAEVFRHKIALFSVVFMPLLFTALPLVVLYGISSSGEIGNMSAGDLTLSDIPLDQLSVCTGLSSSECGQYFILSQFMILFMMMPLIIPSTIAAYGIVGEKTTRTLEPLLATPISTAELLAGKALAAILPAILATLLSFSLYLLGAMALKVTPAVLRQFVGPLWLLAILVVGPLLSLAGASAAIMVSSRVSDPRVAEQISGLMVMPVVLIFVGQMAGFFVLNQVLIAYAALALALVDAGLLYFAVQLFQRETILTRWK